MRSRSNKEVQSAAGCAGSCVGNGTSMAISRGVFRTRPAAATNQEIRNSNLENLNKFEIQNSRAETSAAGKTAVTGHKQMLTTGHPKGGSVVRPLAFLS